MSDKPGVSSHIRSSASEDFEWSSVCACASSVHTSGLVNLQASRKQQGGCACSAHRASPRDGCADYQTGYAQYSESRIYMFSPFCTCVEHLLDDHSHLALQHGVEQLDDEDEAGAEDEQRQSQQDEAHRQVRQVNVGKDVFACKWMVKDVIECPLPARILRRGAKNSLVLMSHCRAKCL